jgi:hypothetical protein
VTADYSQWTFLVPIYPHTTPIGVRPDQFADEVSVALGGMFPYADVRVAVFLAPGPSVVEVYDQTNRRDPEVERLVVETVDGLRSAAYRRAKRYQYVGVN